MISTEARQRIGNILYRYKMILILLAIVLFLSIASNVFLTSGNLINVVKQISVISIVAVGMTFVILTGGIDLSVGAVLAVGGVIAARMTKNEIAPLFVVILTACATGGVLGFINGTLVSRLKVPPFVMTLGMMSIARGISYVYTEGRPIVNFSKNFLFIGQGSIWVIPMPVVIMLSIVVLGVIVLNYTKFGRYVYYIGGNTEAARVSGINVEWILTFVYTLVGALAGLAGLVLTARLNAGQPQAGLSYELDAIAAVVIGGTSLSGGIGSVSGTLVGALIIGIINNGLNLLNVDPFYQLIAKGVVICGAVILDTQTSIKGK